MSIRSDPLKERKTKMTKEAKKKISLARAKRTAFGRFLCRLLGDNAGAVMMEYVVLGVLVVAAVVGIVIAFGGGIKDSFKIMLDAVLGHQNQAQSDKKAQEGSASSAVSAGEATHSTVSGGGQ